MASLASRNPLLLGFLVQLSLRGTHLAENRAGLYEQIVDLWYMALLRDRDVKISDLDSWSAHRSFGILGWLILQVSSPEELSGKTLTQQLSLHFSQELDIKQPNAHRLAEKCLDFWRERGVLEHLQFRHENMYRFVHTTLGEYGAGRYLAKLEISSIQKWIRDKHSNPRWRETILFAAGSGAVDTIVEILLDIDANSNTERGALLLATAALAEANTYSFSLTSQVIERLKIRLISESPLVAYETAEYAAGFVSQSSDRMYSALRPLLEHAQMWTRISAMFLILVGSQDFTDLSKLEQILDEVSKSKREARKIVNIAPETDHAITAATMREYLLSHPDGWIIQNKVVVLGAEVLARLRPDEETKSLLQSLYLSHNISAGTYFKLAEILSQLGCEDFIKQHSPGLSAVDSLIWRNNAHKADVKMLETILRVTKFDFIPPQKPRKLLALTTLVYSLNVPKSGVTDWDILHRLDDIKSIEAVLLGFIQTYAISPKELALDTMWVLNEILETEQDQMSSKSLLSLLPDIPVKLNAPENTMIDVPTEGLVRALRHPLAIIARGALYLLIISKQKEELLDLLKHEDEKILQIIEETTN